MNYINFYYREWKEAESDGKTDYAKQCKDEYRKLVMKKLIKPYNQVYDKLRMYPMINLN